MLNRNTIILIVWVLDRGGTLISASAVPDFEEVGWENLPHHHPLHLFLCFFSFHCSHRGSRQRGRPDITVMVDWAQNTKLPYRQRGTLISASAVPDVEEVGWENLPHPRPLHLLLCPFPSPCNHRGSTQITQFFFKHICMRRKFKRDPGSSHPLQVVINIPRVLRTTHTDPSVSIKFRQETGSRSSPPPPSHSLCSLLPLLLLFPLVLHSQREVATLVIMFLICPHPCHPLWRLPFAHTHRH